MPDFRTPVSFPPPPPACLSQVFQVNQTFHSTLSSKFQTFCPVLTTSHLHLHLLTPVLCYSKITTILPRTLTLTLTLQLLPLLLHLMTFNFILPHQTPAEVQNVLTVAQKSYISAWSVTEVDNNVYKHISSRLVRKIPDYFRGSEKKNRVRAIRYWLERSFLLDTARRTTISQITNQGFVRCYTKAKPGRGRNISAWTEALHILILI